MIPTSLPAQRQRVVCVLMYCARCLLLHQDTIDSVASDPPPIQLKDESDIPILGAAMQAKADVLVTGDSELQNIGKIEELVILSPRGFWEYLRAKHDTPADGK